MTKHENLKTVPHFDRIVKNGTITIPSIFVFTGGCEELFPFLHACGEMNCTVEFANEQIKVDPKGDAPEQNIVLTIYAAIARDPKIANDYIRYLGNMSLMKWS